MRVPALLPVGELLLGIAQRIAAGEFLVAQRFKARLVVLERVAQRIQARLVAADVVGDLRQLRKRFVPRALQARGTKRWCWICCSTRASTPLTS